MHVPLHIAEACAVQEPVHMPMHWPPLNLPMHWAEQLPVAFAEHVPTHLPLQVPEIGRAHV